MAIKEESSAKLKLFGAGSEVSEKIEHDKTRSILIEGLESSFKLNRDRIQAEPDDCAKIFAARKLVDDLSPTETTKKLKEILDTGANYCKVNSKSKHF